jgi:hypothetical protein
MKNPALSMPGMRCAAVITPAVIAMNACQTNKNLQPNEATAAGGGGFDLADANHDGKLSRDEARDFLVNEIFDSRNANLTVGSLAKNGPAAMLRVWPISRSAMPTMMAW